MKSWILLLDAWFVDNIIGVWKYFNHLYVQGNDFKTMSNILVENSHFIWYLDCQNAHFFVSHCIRVKTSYSIFRAWSSNKFEIAAFFSWSDWLKYVLPVKGPDTVRGLSAGSIHANRTSLLIRMPCSIL